MNKTKQFSRSSETGSAIFYVLIAVMLLAALSFAVSSSVRSGGTGDITDSQAKLLASDVLSYMNTVSTAVSQLRLRGCSDTEVSFENPAVAGYTNGNAPGDNTCHVFEPAGGGVTWTDPPAGSIGSAGQWKITGSHHISLIGCDATNSSCSELLLVLEDVNDNVCIKINDLSGITNPSSVPPSQAEDYTGTAFTGAYANNETYNATQIEGRKTGCMTLNGSVNYAFKVLIAR